MAVLISNAGTGTNLQAIIDGVESKKIKAKIVIVISDTKDAYGLTRAKKHKIPTALCPKKEELLRLLKKYQVDYVCLAGWKQIVDDKVINIHKNKILNVHPGAIPDTLHGTVFNPDRTESLWNRGKLTNKAIQNVFDNKKTHAASTLHFLSKEFDFGPVLDRCFEKVIPGDTVDSLYTRLKIKENQMYVHVLTKLCNKKLAKSMKKLKTILIIDAGGRGAALVHKYAQSKHVGRILAVPGNSLMQINTQKPVKIYEDLKTISANEILEICQKENVDLVDVAQDNAVEVGLVNELQKLNIMVVGPTKEAGQIEWNKAWSREFMEKYQIPHPSYRIFHSEKEGIEFIKKQKENKWFVKASGLAEGKGALPANNNKQAIERIQEMKKFKDAGKTYLIEQWLEGEEFSLFVLSDGKYYKTVGGAQDHKRMFNFDQGENTGGIGCSGPPSILTNKLLKEIDQKIIKKAIAGLEKEGRTYKGVLYLGGIVVNNNVYVIEFNARWGDPEAEVIIPSIKNDFYTLGVSIANQNLNKIKIKNDKLYRIAVTMCLRQNPQGKPKQIYGIAEISKMKGITVYGTRVNKINGKYFIGSGRLLHIVGCGKNVIEAKQKAYLAASTLYIEGNNLHYRTDIGWRDMERLRSK